MKNYFNKIINKLLLRKKDSIKHQKAERYFPTIEQGLSSEQVAERKAHKLLNYKFEKQTKSVGRIFFDNIFNFCNMTCLILVIILCAIGAWDYTISSCIVFVNIIIGISQELKAKKVISQIGLVKKDYIDVVREGHIYAIESTDIVLDDIIYIKAGQQVPADCIIKSGECEVDESILTGEALPIKKGAGNNILAGSHIVSGEIICQAEKVGKDCYIAGVIAMAQRISHPKSKIFKALDSLIRGIAIILIILAVIMLIAQRVVVGAEWQSVIIYVASSILGMLPIGIFMLTSCALAVSVLKLSSSKALLQDIYSIEMLAMVDTLLLDKTGTITDGNLRVIDKHIYNTADYLIEDIVITINSVTKDNKPTANALTTYCKKGLAITTNDFMSFSSARKCSAITAEDGKSYFMGAPDFLAVMNQEQKDYCLKNSNNGVRTIMVSEFEGNIDSFDKTKAKVLALFSLEDNLRQEVKGTLAWFRENDVDVRIVSGDDPMTVAYIAGEAGIEDSTRAINCAGLDSATLEESLDNTRIFGRVSPEQKLEIVQGLQKKGKVVGMIGDGVNDVQAIKESDCSISFGSANEVARNVSRIVLMDNKFSSLPAIVKEGRRVVNNIEKVTSLYLMKTIFIMVMTLFYTIITLCVGEAIYPFDTKKLMLFEFFVIGLPTFVFAVQKNEKLITGHFMRNIVKASLVGAITLIFSCLLFYAISGTITVDGIAFERNSNYLNSLLTMSLTVAGFVVLIMNSLPANLLRGVTILISGVLSILSIYIDSTFLGSTFLGMENIMPLHYTILLGIGAFAFIVYCIVNKVANIIDNKVGDKLENTFSKIFKK